LVRFDPSLAPVGDGRRVDHDGRTDEVGIELCERAKERSVVSLGQQWCGGEARSVVSLGQQRASQRRADSDRAWPEVAGSRASNALESHFATMTHNFHAPRKLPAPAVQWRTHGVNKHAAAIAATSRQQAAAPALVGSIRTARAAVLHVQDEQVPRLDPTRPLRRASV
jgi:hypothetical protein